MIPVSDVNLDEEDVETVTGCVRSGWISRYSPVVKAFEDSYARWCGVQYGVSTCSCSSALDLALQALGIGKGDEVIIPTFTMIATANAVTHSGAKLVLVDCEPDTWCINPNEVGHKITKHTKAIIPVHVYGHMCNMGALFIAAHSNHLPVFIIEDAAEAQGSEFEGYKAGWWGDCACFSFFANKNMTTGEGGMIVTKHPILAHKAQWLKANAFGVGLDHFKHEAVGSTVCMSGMQAALGLSQLKKLDSFIEAKRANATLYNSKLKDLAKGGKITLPVEREGYKNCYWMYSILINDSYGITRNALITALAQDGVETRPFFTPIHQQPCYRDHAKEHYPIAESISKRGLNLPSSTKLTREEIEQVCYSIHKFAK